MKKLFIVALGLVILLPVISLAESQPWHSRVGKLIVLIPVRAKTYEQGSSLKISWDTQKFKKELSKLDKISFRFTLVEDKDCSVGEACSPNKYQLVTQDFAISRSGFYKLNLTSFASEVSPGRYALGICPLFPGQSLTKTYVRKYCGLSGSFNISPSTIATPPAETLPDTTQEETQFTPYEENYDDTNNYDPIADEENYDDYPDESFTEGQTTPLSVTITSPLSGSSYTLESDNGVATAVVNLEASASGGVAPYSYDWTEGLKSLGSGEKLNVNIPDIGSHTVELLITDSAGSQTAKTVSFNVVKGSNTGPAIPPLITNPPKITSVTSPVVASGTVTIIGTGFTPSGNVVSVGTALQTSISTSDGTTLKFSLLNRVPVGTYKLSVTNANGKSNEVSLIVALASRTGSLNTGQTNLLANIWNVLLNLFK